MKNLILLFSLSVLSLGHSQTYTIDWQKIASAGGTSRGGKYTLTFLVDQADAGKMTGGPYTLAGGFLSIVLVQTPGAPILSIQLSGQTAILSWPADATGGFVLEESVSLNPPLMWGPSRAPVTTTAGNNSAVVLATPRRFYRLRKP